MIGLLSASSPNAWGFGTSSALPHAAPSTTSAIAPAHAAARPALVVIRCICMVSIISGVGGRGLEAGPELNAPHARRGLHQESVVEDEGLRATPVHVRIDAIAVIPPHDVLPGKRDLRRPGLHAVGQAKRQVPRDRELAKTHVVALVVVVQDRGVLPDGVG